MAVEIGTRLGPYEILATLGEGGMGEVYRAQDHKLGRQVALKVLRKEASQDSESMARFSREARNLATLNIPTVAAVYDLDEINGSCSWSWNWCPARRWRNGSVPRAPCPSRMP